MVFREVHTASDILPAYAGTPIADLLSSHALGVDVGTPESVTTLIVSCMDPRIRLDIPERFAFQLRTAGATPEPLMTNVAFAVGVAGVRSIAVIGHTDCAMCRAAACADQMVDHLVSNEGWNADYAANERAALNDVFKIDDAAEATVAHVERLRTRFPSCVVAPLLYRVEDDTIVQIDA